MKDRKLLFSPYSIVNKLDEEHLCLCPPMKLLTNNLLNSSKELTKFKGILPNHTRVRPLRVVGKALHIISSGTPWRCIVVLKVLMWSNGSRVPSYESREGNLNFDGRGWPLMEAVKGESVLWTKSSIGFALLMFSFISSMTFFIWSISSFKCGTVREVVPLNWLPISVFSLSSWLCVCPPPSRSSCVYLLRLISLLNSWFWWVNFRHCSRHRLHMDRWCLHNRCRLAIAMGVAWSISASLMAWASSPRSGPNHQPFVTEKKIAKQFLSHRRHQLIIPRKSVGWWVSNVDDLKAWPWK